MKIFSDGSQTIRVTLGVHSISVKVLDYYGGSPSYINEYAGLYGLGRIIRTSDTVKGVIKLQFMEGR